MVKHAKDGSLGGEGVHVKGVKLYVGHLEVIGTRNGREEGEGGNKSISLINYETNVLIEISN